MHKQAFAAEWLSHHRRLSTKRSPRLVASLKISSSVCAWPNPPFASAMSSNDGSRLRFGDARRVLAMNGGGCLEPIVWS